MYKETAAIILTGGKSKRMGYKKQNVPIKSITTQNYI